MAVLLLVTGAVVYERMDFALNRSIHDVPSSDRTEIRARERHRDEALSELIGQLAAAFAGTLLIAGFVGYRVARAALDPVERMRRRASAESADLSFRLPVPASEDELSRLAETLNALLARAEAGVNRERQLIADASHELRTPLSQMLLRIDLALSRPRTSDEHEDTLEGLQQDTGRLVRLANDLLLIARADEGRLPLNREPVDLFELADETRTRFLEAARLAGREIVVATDHEVRVDAQALDNLVGNALDHGAGTTTIRYAAADGVATLHVTDEGAGFPRDFADRAFDRFATANAGRSGSGTGLGLAIVAAIAAAHGGRAQLGAGAPGADVWMALPLADGQFG
jgi:signal transduction histidine kinase